MNHKNVLEVTLLAVIAALSCAGWAQTADLAAIPSADIAPTQSDPQFSQRYPRYRVAPDDIMDISFTFSPELNQTVTVQPDGFINLKEVGDIHVQDQTTTQVAELVHKAYAKILHDPAITVVLKDFNKPSFIVGGEVHHPTGRGSMTCVRTCRSYRLSLLPVASPMRQSIRKCGCIGAFRTIVWKQKS